MLLEILNLRLVGVRMSKVEISWMRKGLLNILMEFFILKMCVWKIRVGIIVLRLIVVNLNKVSLVLLYSVS